MRWIWLALLLCACTGPNLDEDPLVILGTGEVGWEDLEDGDSVSLVSGLQGGQHIWGAVRVAGIDWLDVDLTFRVHDLSDSELTPPTLLNPELNPCETDEPGCELGMGEIVGITILVEDPSSILGHDVILIVEASDDGGRSASDEFTTVVNVGR